MALKALYRVHKWAALALAVPLLVQLATGVFLATRHASHATAPVAAWQGSLDAALDAASAALPGARLDRLTWLAEDEPRLEVRAWLPGQDQPSFVEIGGDGTATAAGSLYAYPDKLFLYVHANLLAGSPGRWIVVVSGVVLFALLVTGLVLWWPWHRTWRDAYTLHTKWKSQHLLFDVHRVAGAYVAPIAVLTVAAGTVLALQPYFAPSIPAAACAATTTQQTTPTHAAAAPLDTLRAAVETRWPAHGVRQVRFCDPERRVVGLMLQPREARAFDERLQVWIDRRAPGEWRVFEAADRGAAGLLDRLLLPIHTGAAAGAPGRWLVAASGLLLFTLGLVGLVLWFVRARDRRAKAARRAAAQRVAT